jgi:hypothetical protein
MPYMKRCGVTQISWLKVISWIIRMLECSVRDARFSHLIHTSLLLGIDEDRHEIACGLVDTIGKWYCYSSDVLIIYCCLIRKLYLC